MAYLVTLKGGSPGRIELSGDRLVIGRSPDCGVVLAADAVSRHHLQIVRDGQAFFIEDLNSRNGTYVNGSKVIRPTPLMDNACIKIGELLLTFHTGVNQPASKPGLELLITPTGEDSSVLVSSLDPSSTDTALQAPHVQTEAKLRAILEISQSLRAAVRLDDVLPKILESLFRILPQADHGSVLLHDEAAGGLVPKAVRDRRGHDDKSLRISQTIVKHVMQQAQAILLADTSNMQMQLGQSIESFRIRSIMCAPLLNQKNQPQGIIQVYTENRKHQFTNEDLEVLITVASAASIAMENAQLHEELMEQERLKRELQFARDVQRRFLPPSVPEVPGYGFYAYYEAAYSVGGDYYGFIDLPDGRLAISLGDVAGKGIPAALLMAHLSSDIRLSAITATDPAMAVDLVKRSIIAAGLDDKFITLLFMVLDTKKHTLSIGNAGHLPPLLRLSDGTVKSIGEVETGLPLNVNLDAEYKYQTCRISLEPGSTVLLYTDGVTELLNPAGEMFRGFRLEKAFQNAPPDPAHAGEFLIEELHKFAAGRHQGDDITLLCVGRKA